jgi:hypothetical protein
MLTNGSSPTPSVNLLDATGNIDASLYDHTPPIDVILQGSQMSQNENASCPKWNGVSSAWKGQIDPSGLSTTFAPSPSNPRQVPVDTGNSNIDTILVSMCVALYGPGHDPTGVSAPPDPNVCWLLVPIADQNNPPNQANIVTLACFSLYDGSDGKQKWRGILHKPMDCKYGVYVPSWTYGNTNRETRVFLTQ